MKLALLEQLNEARQQKRRACLVRWLATAEEALVIDGEVAAGEVPPDLLPELGAAIVRMRRTEALILEPARAPGFDFARFEAAWTAFEAART